jgi:3-hydroxyisobutyrate dehydrogenase-like beta-hydroxyacid dehydrogenase
MTKVLVIGLGEIGLATAKYYLNEKCDVYGFDIDRAARIIAESCGIEVYRAIDDMELDMDVISICVPTSGHCL